MPLNTGTMSLADLQAITNQTVPQFGLDAVADVLRRDLEVHNRLTAEMFRDVAEITADPLRRTGVSGSGEMVEVDDYGRAPTQKPGAGGTVGLPLKLFQFAIGWTQRWINKATPAQVAEVQLNAQTAHRRALVRDFKRAIYAPTNLSTTDYTQVNKIDLPVKRFYNADGFTIPNGPNGETFDGSTLTHYTAAASLAAAGLLTSVNLVQAHSVGGNLQTWINAADEAAVRALTGFQAYVDSRLVLPNNTAGTPLQRLNPANTGNRAIGLFGPSEVWVKPYAIANYAVTLDVGASGKPLGLRTENGQAPALVRVAENDVFPLIAQYMESLFGFGALNRGAGAVHYWGGGDTTYDEPTIS